MSYEDLFGLLIGIGALVAMFGYLADVYLYQNRFHTKAKNGKFMTRRSIRSSCGSDSFV
jgi:hypothetical protein